MKELFIVGILLGAVLAFTLYNKGKYELKRRIRIRDIMNMSPIDFEHYIARIYKKNGYHTVVTPPSGDGGKDIIAYKSRRKYYIECKHFDADGVVGRPIAQKLVGAMYADNVPVSNGIIVTTGKYSKPCLEYCKECGIKTLNINDILNMEKRVR